MYQLYTQIVPAKSIRSQIVSIGIYGGYYEEYGHSGKKECAHFFEILCIFKKEKNQSGSQIEKPQTIWDYKVFHEWDIVV